MALTRAQTRKATNAEKPPSRPPAKRAKMVFVHIQRRGNPKTKLRSIPSLPQLPGEIVDIIAGSLRAGDLGNLRLTCKELETKTQFRFGREYFRVKNFVHSKYAFERLAELSKSRMARYVHTLHFRPSPDDHGVFLFVDGVSPKKANILTRKLSEFAAENRLMKSLGQDATMLLLAFEGFRYVQDLIFLATDPTADFSVVGSHPLKPEEKKLVTFMEHPSHRIRNLARLFLITLQAAQTAELMITTIDAQYPKAGSCCSGSTAWDFPLPALKNSSLLAFTGLCVLRLSLGNPEDVQQDSHFVSRLSNFLSATPGLLELGLTFLCASLKIEGFLLSLAKTNKLFRLINLSIHFEQYDDLDNKLFFELLQNLSHIRSLEWDWLTVEEDSAKSILEWIRDNMSQLTALGMVLRFDEAFYNMWLDEKDNENLRYAIDEQISDIAPFLEQARLEIESESSFSEGDYPSD